MKGDRVQLQQVLLNLIVNGLDAMEETPAEDRNVVIRLSCRDGSDIQVAVRDAGTGIAKDKLDQVFTPFVTSKPSGLGMGLAITAENNPGRGATFWFTVPAAAAT